MKFVYVSFRNALQFMKPTLRFSFYRLLVFKLKEKVICHLQYQRQKHYIFLKVKKKKRTTKIWQEKEIKPTEQKP